MDADFGLVLELLATHDDNCKRAEKYALRTIFSLEVSVFNVLRDITPFNLLTALRRVEDWFGKVRTIEHSIFLVVLTDYVSCAYNQRSLYRTFENALTEKFMNSLFEKLYDEWTKIFDCSHHSIHFSDSEIQSIRKSLLRSANRFSESFRHKYLFSRLVQLCENYCTNILEANLQNVDNNLPKSLPLIELSPEKISRKDNYYKNSTKILPKKKIRDITKYVVRQPIRKELPSNKIMVDSLPVSKTNENITSLDQLKVPTNKEEKMSIVNVNNDNSDFKCSLKTDSMESVISICDCCDCKGTNHIEARADIHIKSASKRLNAFDILMKKVIPPKQKCIF